MAPSVVRFTQLKKALRSAELLPEPPVYRGYDYLCSCDFEGPLHVG